MAKKPDGSGTTNTTPGSCVDVACKPNLNIIYRIQASSSGLFYALELNGTVPEKFKDHSLGVTTDGKSEIKWPVQPGDCVALYLNSDAHPDYRKQKVYAITVGDNDVVVTIKEKTGKHADSDTPTQAETKAVKNAKGEERQVDYYSAPLTGDIWLKISHPYTTGEVDTILPASVAKEVSQAVKKFYDGSLSKTVRAVDIVIPAQGDVSARKTQIYVGPGGDDNALANINQSFDLFTDGLPRVHPLGYLALIESALDAGVEKVTLSSTWRPLLGSIAHRAGLGLDVNYLDKTRLNREELRGKGPDTDNVSEEEKEKLKEKEAAKQAAAEAKAKLKKLQDEKDALDALKKKTPNKASPIREAELEKEIPIAKAEMEAAQKKAGETDKAWNDERDKNEPAKVKSYRASLAKCKHLRQIYDPWFMDDESRDKTPATPNEQRKAPSGKGKSNEELHANHLHITVVEPKLSRQAGNKS